MHTQWGLNQKEIVPEGKRAAPSTPTYLQRLAFVFLAWSLAGADSVLELGDARVASS